MRVLPSNIEYNYSGKYHLRILMTESNYMRDCTHDMHGIITNTPGMAYRWHIAEGRSAPKLFVVTLGFRRLPYNCNRSSPCLCACSYDVVLMGTTMAFWSSVVTHTVRGQLVVVCVCCKLSAMG